MTQPIDDEALDRLWRESRSQNAWTGEDVPERLVRMAYDLAKLGPTSGNSSPARFLFLRSQAAKARLLPHLSEGNREKTAAAPWVAVIAYDLSFYEKMPELFPGRPGMFAAMRDKPEAAKAHAIRNATLQGAYLMLAARSVGLDIGPMSGIDAAGIDGEFFLNDPDRSTWRTDFVCNIGYGSGPSHSRLPRLDFETACGIL